MTRKPSIWIYALTVACMTLFVLVAGWLAYACSPNTPPVCPMDPGFEWRRDFGVLRPPASSDGPGLGQVGEFESAK
jgi:hypothetical protein